MNDRAGGGSHAGDQIDTAAPMASAAIKYRDDGTVDWGNMWDSYCVLARDGGPAHRETMLYAQQHADTTSETYRTAVAEIIRGIREVSDLDATEAETGWIAVRCSSAGMARWLADSIELECVQARAEGKYLFVPCGDYFTVKGEVKNVVTAVAKTSHYWTEHLPVEVKRTLAVHGWLGAQRARLRRWLGR